MQTISTVGTQNDFYLNVYFTQYILSVYFLFLVDVFYVTLDKELPRAHKHKHAFGCKLVALSVHAVDLV